MSQPFLHTTEDLAFLYNYMQELDDTRANPVTLSRLQQIMLDAHRVYRYPAFYFRQMGEDLWSFQNASENPTHLYKMTLEGFVLKELK